MHSLIIQIIGMTKLILSKLKQYNTDNQCNNAGKIFPHKSLSQTWGLHALRKYKPI